MVDIIRPIYRPVKFSSPTNKVKESSNIEKKGDERDAEPYVVTKDRRKKYERRTPRGGSRNVYDMRSGRDRRRESGKHPYIEIKA
ncbi:MAG: hypothetical protein ACI9Y1_000608 [Lentisphaeria bacterium]|jgi:hypothetical protein